MWRKHVCVRQASDRDCGAACLATISIHHGKRVGLEQLRQWSGTDKEGTNLLGIIRAAERLGLSARAFHGSLEALAGVPLPAVVHLLEDGSGHYVVLHRLTAKGVLIADPARGLRKLSRDAFARLWTGYIVVMVPDDNPIQMPAKTDSPASKLRKLVCQHLGLVIESIVCAVFMTLLGLSTSYFIQHLVDSVLVRHEVSLLNALAIGMLVAVVFRVLFCMLRSYLLAHVSRRVDLALMSSYMRHILHLPLSFFETRRTGEIMSRLNDATKIREAISGATVTAVVDGALVVLLLNALVLYDLKLGLVTLGFAPALAGAVMLHHGAARRTSRRAMEDSAKYSAHVVEDISAVETIKAFCGERDRGERGDDALVKLVQSSFSLEMLGLSMNSLAMGVTATAGVVILWLGGMRVMEGALTVGQLLFFYTVLSYLLAPLERLAGLNLQLQDALVAVDRLYQVMEMEPEQTSGPSEKLSFTGVRNSIEFSNVHFRYGTREEVLRGVSLQVPAGKKVAIVGESGSGKSTLMKLLLNFYDPTRGNVTFDGVDIRDIDIASLRRRIGVVSQDPFIFNGSIHNNITLGRDGLSFDEVVEAARLAGLDSFIQRLPDRFNTLIGERGANLSGGQRQRLAIARALVAKPDVLIFDEATSHLDTATERFVQQNLQQNLHDRTVIIVAHRLSTVKDADIIYVMDDGQVIQQGCHETLLNSKDRYAELWHAQTHWSGAQSDLVQAN